MDKRREAPRGDLDNGNIGQMTAFEDWRALLRERAEYIVRTGSNLAHPDGIDEAALSRALGPYATATVGLVDTLAVGARNVSGNQLHQADFSNQLELVFDAVSALVERDDSNPDSETESPPHVIQSELWQVLRKVRESAELSYSREQYLIELDRRLLFLLQNVGALVPADISNAVGVDKAQVSRSVKRLLELRLVERTQIRAPLTLTRDGERLAKRLLRMAELRNRELIIDITDDELSEFFEVIEILLDRAMVLYDQERAMVQGGRASDDADDSDRSGEKVVIDRSRIIAPLMTLSAYFSRSGALAFKRLTGLSTFEAFVLSEIGAAPPIDWSTLVGVLARDHSQAARTVNSLVDRGLVAREGRPGRRHGRFYPTDDGQKLWEVIQEAGRNRSAFLLAPLEPDQRARFLATFDKVRRNAVAQLARERAFADIDRS